MKHNIKVSLIIVGLFLVAQFIGLYVIDSYFEKELPFGIESPEIQEDTSYMPMAIAIIIATGLALLLINFGAERIWKIWFLLASLYLLTISLGAFINQEAALISSIAFISLRYFRPSIISHNIIELFVYAGIASLFVPIFNQVNCIYF